MSEREWRCYIDDMLRFAEKVRTCSAHTDRRTFERDELKYDPCAGRGARAACRPSVAGAHLR